MYKEAKNVNEDNGLLFSNITLDDITEAVADVVYRKGFKELVTFKEIVDYAKEEKIKNPRISSFVISVKRNYDPQNENDKLVIIQGFLDENRKTISVNGKDAESRIIHTRTIDKQFIEVLNGLETRIVKL